MSNEAIHEGELVIVFFGLRGATVRQIDRGHADDSLAPWDDRLDITRLFIIRVARKPPHDLDRRLSKNCDAIESFLPVHRGIVAFRLNLGLWKANVDAF